MDKGFEIADIIVAFIKGNATPEQIVRLDEWQNESDENKRLGLFHCWMKQIFDFASTGTEGIEYRESV